MKNKLYFLIKWTMAKKMKTKWFKIINFILLILIVGVINLNSIIKFFGGDFDTKNTIYINSSKEVYDIVYPNLDGYLKSLGELKDYEIKHVESDLEKIKDSLEESQDIIIDFYEENSLIKANLISYDKLDSLTNQIVNEALNSSKTDIYISSLDISLEEKNNLKSPMEITITYLNEEVSNTSKDEELLTSVLIPIFIVPFFILIVLLVQTIGADVNEEKTTRGMEIIISSVSPKIHFFSKIIGSSLFVLSQFFLLLLYALVGVLVQKLIGSETSIFASLQGISNVLTSSGVMDNLTLGIIGFFVMFILSLLIYALFAGILASMTTSMEDYQQLQMPIMIICMLGYYLAIMAGVFEGALFIKVASYLPFLSVMLSPILFLLGQVSLLDMMISIILLIITFYLLFHYGLRIYKVGILNYSSKDLWKKMFRSLKE